MADVWVERWPVQGTSGKTWTVARKANGEWGCSCPAWTMKKNKGRPDCQHILKIKLQMVGEGKVSVAPTKNLGKTKTENTRSITFGDD